MLKKNKIEILIDNDEYIKWLEVIIDRFSFFFDNENLDVDKYSLHDIENMKLLGEFYNLVDKYAKNKLICPQKDSLGISYVIKYGNNHYHVGIGNDSATEYYCIRNIESETMVIEYEDLKNNMLYEKLEEYKEKSEQLETIESVYFDTIQKVKRKN